MFQLQDLAEILYPKTTFTYAAEQL